MRATGAIRWVNGVLQWASLIFLVSVLLVFGALSTRFLTLDNFVAILSQSSWLIAVAVGMNFVLLTAGVDLSVGAAMYLAVVVLSLGFAGAPAPVCILVATVVGVAFGALNGMLVVRWGVPAFIVTLATVFIGRGLGFYLSSTKIVFAGSALAEIGRNRIGGIPIPVCLAGTAVLLGAVILRATPFGSSIRAVGSDREGAHRAGVPVQAVTWAVYCLCGAFAGFGGFISFSQTSAATGAFGQNAEFLAIAAAVLGGTSLFGGRGTWYAPVLGALLIMTVQNGLVLINANPYAYPVITGSVIFLAALLDSVRLRFIARTERRRICPDELDPAHVPIGMPSYSRAGYGLERGEKG
jgi:ribose/xylose/arabinose/galactoside ABC-type transport system permease subunit